MNRRHLIVHRGDKFREMQENLDTLAPITIEEVNKWQQIVAEFCASVIGDVLEKNLLT